MGDLLRDPFRKKPVHEISVIQTRASEDRKDFNIEETHERTGRLVQRRRWNTSWKNGTVADQDVSLKSMMVNEADMDFRIPGLPHSVAKFRKLRTIQIDMLLNKIYDRINHLIRSVKNQSKWYRMLGTSNCVSCSRRNLERSAQCVYHIVTLVYSTARAGTSCLKEEGKIRISLVIRWTFVQSLSTSSRREDFMHIDMVKSCDTKNILRLANWRRNGKIEISKESVIDSYHFKNSVIEWLKIIETKIFVVYGCSCGWRSHSPFDRKRIPRL